MVVGSFTNYSRTEARLTNYRAVLIRVVLRGPFVESFSKLNKLLRCRKCGARTGDFYRTGNIKRIISTRLHKNYQMNVRRTHRWADSRHAYHRQDCAAAPRGFGCASRTATRRFGCGHVSGTGRRLYTSPARHRVGCRPVPVARILLYTMPAPRETNSNHLRTAQMRLWPLARRADMV